MKYLTRSGFCSIIYMVNYEREIAVCINERCKAEVCANASLP